MINAPIRFTPHYMQRVWGGRRLESLLGRTLPDASMPYGESWEISDRPEAQSIVAEGPFAGQSLNDLWTRERAQVFGDSLLSHPAPRFPLLMKVLDACDDLSIQVHPPEAAIAAIGGEPKTEMWFIVHADPGAKLYVGLKPGIDRDAFRSALAEGTVAAAVNVLEPSTGDCLFIPSGRLHAIGKGLVIFEIQQNSDTTFRVFDWNRTGLDGKPRQLHIDESLASIQFDDHDPQFSQPTTDGTLVSCSDFIVRKREVTGDSERVALGTPSENLSIAVLEGRITLAEADFQPGDFFVLPAAMEKSDRYAATCGRTSWLEIQIPIAQT